MSSDDYKMDEAKELNEPVYERSPLVDSETVSQMPNGSSANNLSNNSHNNYAQAPPSR